MTDQGYLDKPSVVWETLSSIDGDGHYVDDKFVTVAPTTTTTTAPLLEKMDAKHIVSPTADANNINCDQQPSTELANEATALDENCVEGTNQTSSGSQIDRE